MKIETIKKLLSGTEEDCIVLAELICEGKSEEEVFNFLKTIQTEEIIATDERHLPARPRFEIKKKQNNDIYAEISIYYKIGKSYLCLTPGYSMALCWRKYVSGIKTIENEG